MQNSFFKSVIMLASMAVLAGGCNKDKPKDPFATSDTSLTAWAVEASNKALISNQSFAVQAGNVIDLHDYYQPEGTNKWYSYVDTDITSTGVEGAAWDYPVGENFYWTLTGVHKAFGWLKTDAASSLTTNGFFSASPSFDENAKTLTIPATEITSASDQYDFLYSVLSTRTLAGDATNDYSPIKLEMWHLFTAIGFGIKNSTKVDINMKSIKFQGLVNNMSAVLDYSDFNNDVDVRYIPASTPKTDNHFEYTGAEFTISPGGSVKNMITNVTGGENETKYFIMWPQTADQLQPQNPYNIDPDTGLFIENTTDALIVLEYVSNGVTVKRALAFPEGFSFEAGHRYHFDIEFAEKQTQLIVRVNPWNYEEELIDFSDASVAVKDGGELVPTADSYIPDPDDDRVLYCKPGIAVNFTFSLDAPAGGMWMVSLLGDWNRFNISPSQGTIDSSLSEFTIAPIQDVADRDYVATVRIVVLRSDGTTTPAEDLQKVGEEYKPFTIIQQKTK